MNGAVELLLPKITPALFSAGDVLIQQDAGDNQMYFILSGEVSVQVHGGEVARRRAGQHVGEMALIDPSAPRSATVVALREVIAGSISESDFVTVANKYPKLWRRLAVELGDRLRERNKLIRLPNPIPRVFLGSSKESLKIAKCLGRLLSAKDREIVLWSDGVFALSATNIESLEATLYSTDFAILVLGPDDWTISRGRRQLAPRDNVVFELGLFMGHLGRKRSFLVQPIGLDIKIPSDLWSVNPARFSTNKKVSLEVRLKPLANEILRSIANEGVRRS